MVLGEDLDVEDYFFEDSSDDETSYIEEESDFYISPDDTDSLLKTYEESFDYGTDDASGFDESLEVYIQKVLQHEKDNPNVFSAGECKALIKINLIFSRDHFVNLDFLTFLIFYFRIVLL